MCKQFRRELFRQTTFCHRNLQFLNHCLVSSPLVGYATLKNFLHISSSLGACHLLLLWPWPLSLLGAKPLYLDCAIFYRFWNVFQHNTFRIFRLTHHVVTCDVDRDVSTAYCSLGDLLSHGSPVVVVVFFIVGIHVSGNSIPLSLLMLLGWSLIWIASLTLHV